MGNREFENAISAITRKDPRYHKDAYDFMREALDYTQSMVRRSEKVANADENHVSAEELLEGSRAFALMRYGPMTKFLLHEWGVFTCEDFGEIVFNMIDQGILRKTEDDRREDFSGKFEFYEAFDKPYLPPPSAPVVRGCGDFPARHNSLRESSP